MVIMNKERAATERLWKGKGAQPVKPDALTGRIIRERQKRAKRAHVKGIAKCKRLFIDSVGEG